VNPEKQLFIQSSLAKTCQGSLRRWFQSASKRTLCSCPPNNVSIKGLHCHEGI